MIALIDADSIVYRIGFATENESESVAKLRTDSFIKDILEATKAKEFYGYLTGKTNYRSSLAKTAPYKGQRKGVRPKHYDHIREVMCSAWGFTIEEGQEADDAVAIHSTALTKEGKKHVICSIDKDLLQLVGTHYNFVKGEFDNINQRQALLNLYTQCLTGDKIDNIIGIYGIGKVKAAKILKGAKDECEMYQRCVEAYKGDKGRVDENLSLLWLRRGVNQMWEPPCTLNGLTQQPQSDGKNSEPVE